MPLARIETVWTDVPGSPYLTTLYFDVLEGFDAQGLIDAVDAFWQDCSVNMTNFIRWRVEGEVATVDEATDEVTDFSLGSAVIGGGASLTAPIPYANQVNIRLRTGGIRAGRRVLGHIYVPGSTLDAGIPSLSPADVVTYNAAAETLRQAAIANLTPLTVYSRPREATDELPALAGQSSPVTEVNTTSKYAVLRSRRD